MLPSFTLRPEQAADRVAVDTLYARAFGPGRFARTGFCIRRGSGHDTAVSFVAQRRGLVIGAVRQTKVLVGGEPAYLLGPLAVAETAAKQGIGRALLARSVSVAGRSQAAAIVLIGDPAVYGSSGFVTTGPSSIAFPGPTEPERVLIHVLRAPVQGRLVVADWA